MMDRTAIAAEWVIGTYTGDRAKSVKAHADAGIGYFVQKSGGMGTNFTVVAAFRRAIDGPRPQHLELATSIQVQKLEELYKIRNNIRDFDRPVSSGLTHIGILQGKASQMPTGDR